MCLNLRIVDAVVCVCGMFIKIYLIVYYSFYQEFDYFILRFEPNPSLGIS